MATYVLVCGAWLGGCCWQPIARQLRNQGHDAYPLTLTGLGERVHLASPEVNLDTHITDVVNLIEFEDLNDVVLVGHSYAALAVTGAADQMPERISQLVLVDIGQALDGVALIDTFEPEARRLVEQQLEELGEGWRLPMPPWEELVEQGSLEGLGDEQRRLMRSRAVDQPFATYTQPLRLENTAAREVLSKIGILCSFSLEQVQAMIASGEPAFSELASPKWRFVEVPTGHWAMFSRPHDLAEVLLDVPSGDSRQDDGEHDN
jgi:pimeloyl-ACP methyl ester carboxylesterase